MALIIKADMPKACNWFDENGKHHFCKVNAFCDCRIYTRDKRPSDCPILGEIPEKHGRLIDADKLAEEFDGHGVFMEEEVKKIIGFFPIVLEAST